MEASTQQMAPRLLGEAISLLQDPRLPIGFLVSATGNAVPIDTFVCALTRALAFKRIYILSNLRNDHCGNACRAVPNASISTVLRRPFWHNLPHCGAPTMVQQWFSQC